MIEMIRGFGLDLALRHGAIVYGKWELGRLGHTLVKDIVVFEWGKGTDNPGIGQNASDLEIRKFCNIVFKKMKHSRIPRVPIGVDFDPNSVYWGNKKQAVTLSFMAGYMARCLELLGYPVIFITPKEVRGRLELGGRTNKKIVWALFPEIRRHKTATEDMKDSLVLSYLVARGYRIGNKNLKQTDIHHGKAKRKNTHHSKKAA